jgi:hypothetical protein
MNMKVTSLMPRKKIFIYEYVKKKDDHKRKVIIKYAVVTPINANNL